MREAGWRSAVKAGFRNAPCRPILLVCLGALVWPAQAEVIQIAGPCGAARVCSGLATDTGADVQLSARPGAASFQVVIDGKTYRGTRHRGSQIDEVATAEDGTQVLVRVTFEHRGRKVNMGRAHYNIQRWSVTGGTLER